MVGQTHRTVKTAAKLRNRLQPRLGRDLEPIENRLQALGYHTKGPGSQLTTRPVQQLQITLKGHRQKAPVAGSTRATRTDTLRGCGDNLRRWRCCRQPLGTLIQLDGTEPAIAARRHVVRTWPRVFNGCWRRQDRGRFSGKYRQTLLHQSGRYRVRQLMRAGSLQGLLPGAPTDPGVHVKCTRFVTLWNRCPPHDWVVSR